MTDDAQTMATRVLEAAAEIASRYIGNDEVAVILVILAGKLLTDSDLTVEDADIAAMRQTVKAKIARGWN